MASATPGPPSASRDDRYWRIAEAQREVFASLVRKEPLRQALTLLVRAIESLVDGMIASVLLLDEEGRHLHTGAAPNLPASYNAAIEGAAIGPSAGSCGTAAYRGELVVVSDTFSDPLWADYRELARSHGLRACWSCPIRSGSGKVLGTFAMYFRDARAPGDFELRLVKDATDAAALCIEHVRARDSLDRTIALLRESENRFRMLSEATFEGIAIHREGKLLLTNQSGATLFGYEASELAGMDIRDFVAPESWESVAPRVARLEEGPYEFMAVRKDGTKFWAELRAKSIDYAGLAARVLACRDISARKTAENRLKRSESLFRALFESSPVGIALIGTERGSFTRVNRRLCQITGYSSDELLGVPFTTHLHPDDRGSAAASYQNVLDGRTDTYAAERRILRKDGRIIWIDVNVAAIPGPAGAPLSSIVAVQDITARKDAERERDALYREAKSAIQARDEFILVASHELRTPLTPLKLQIQLLARSVDEPSRFAEVKTLLTDSSQQVDRLSKLVENLLDVSRIGTGRLRLTPEAVDLGDLAAGVARRFAAELDAKRCPFELRVEPGVIGDWDRIRIEQVVTNLLSNASKYGAGSPIEIRVFRQGTDAVLEVTDHGLGIAAEDQARIFNRYERAVSSRAFGGLGLGLFISRQIVESHGGTIYVRSRPGQGSTFKVVLPIRSARTEALTRAA